MTFYYIALPSILWLLAYGLASDPLLSAPSGSWRPGHRFELLIWHPKEIHDFEVAGPRPFTCKPTGDRYRALDFRSSARVVGEFEPALVGSAIAQSHLGSADPSKDPPGTKDIRCRKADATRRIETAQKRVRSRGTFRLGLHAPRGGKVLHGKRPRKQMSVHGSG